MKKKVGTILDARLFGEAKRTAKEEHRPLSHLVESAIRFYLSARPPNGRTSAVDVVRRTYGAMKASPRIVRAALKAPNWYEV